MSRVALDSRGSVEPLAAASDAACDLADRTDFRDRAVERRAGAERSRRATATTAPPPPSAARVPPCWSARNGATFPQKLFVELRRAGWPVSPVLEGRVQIDGRSFRLLGIEPVTLPVEVGNAPAIGKADLQSFLTPPGRNAGRAGDAVRSRSARRRDAAGERRHVAAAAARAGATGAGRAGGRYRHRAAAAEQAGPDFPPADRQGQRQARAARKHRRRPAPPGRSPMRRATSNASPTAFIST